MSDESRLLGVVGRLYEAACEPTQWRGAVESYAELVGGRGAHLLLTDARSGRVLLGVVAGFDESVSEEYVEHFAAQDERIPRVLALPRRQPAQHHDLYHDGERRRSVTWNEFLVPHGGPEQALVRLQGPPDTEIVLGTIRGFREGPFHADELLLARHAYPHIERAVQLSRHLLEVQARASAALDALDVAPFGAVLLSEQGRVLAVNRRGRTLLAGCRELSLRGSRLHAARLDDDRRLQRLIGQAIATATGEPSAMPGGSMGIHRERGDAALGLLVSPMPLRAGLFAAIRPAAAVFIHDRAHAPNPSWQALAILHELTPTEARLAAAIAAGSTVAEFAATADIAESTVRWHLKNVLAKTGTRSQADLVRTILRGPAALDPGGVEAAGDK